MADRPAILAAACLAALAAGCGALKRASAAPARDKRGHPVIRYSRPPEPAEPPIFKPFDEVVCRVEAEGAVLGPPELATVQSREGLFPYSCGSTPSDEGVWAYRQEASGRAVLALHVHRAKRPEGSPSLARIRFQVPEPGEYYVFLKGDSCCCGSSSLEFRLDGGPAQVVPICWGIGEWRWESLRRRTVERKHDRPIVIPQPVRLAAGAHAVDIAWAGASCAPLLLDELVVARRMRLVGRGPHGAVGEGLLLSAVEMGDRELVKVLLAQGAPVNVWPLTPLMVAERGGREEIASLLRQHGALPSKEVARFVRAVEWAELGIVEALLRTTPGLLKLRTQYRRTPLHLVAARGGFATWRQYSDDAREQAASRDRARIAALFIAQGAEADTREDLHAWTALHWAAYRGCLETAKVLVAHGADAGARDSCGRTPLHVAVEGREPELVGFLLSLGVDVDFRADGSWSPLHEAANSNEAKIATLLLDHGADVNALGFDRRTPLWSAASRGHADVARLLLGRGAAVDRTDRERWTPLHVAAGSGHHQTVRLLLGHRADPNAKDDKQRTPLHHALKAFHVPRWEKARDYFAVVRALIAAGAHPDAKDEDGRTPLECAREAHREAIARILAAGAPKGRTRP